MLQAGAGAVAETNVRSARLPKWLSLLSRLSRLVDRTWSIKQVHFVYKNWMGLLEREASGSHRPCHAKGLGDRGAGADQQPGIHLVICQTSRTSKHFYNPCTNTTATRADLIRLRAEWVRRGEQYGEWGQVRGMVGGIWKKCCYNNQNALNCKTYNFTVIFSLVSCSFFFFFFFFSNSCLGHPSVCDWPGWLVWAWQLTPAST